MCVCVCVNTYWLLNIVTGTDQLHTLPKHMCTDPWVSQSICTHNLLKHTATDSLLIHWMSSVCEIYMSESQQLSTYTQASTCIFPGPAFLSLWVSSVIHWYRDWGHALLSGTASPCVFSSSHLRHESQVSHPSSYFWHHGIGTRPYLSYQT